MARTEKIGGRSNEGGKKVKRARGEAWWGVVKFVGGGESSLDHIFRNDKSVATATRAVDEFQRKECLDYQTTIGWLVVSEHLFLIAFNRGETTTVFEGTSEESKLIDGSSSNVRKFVQILVMVAQPRRSSTPLQLSDCALSRSSLNSTGQFPFHIAQYPPPNRFEI